jgi:hypothetical protein
VGANTRFGSAVCEGRREEHRFLPRPVEAGSQSRFPNLCRIRAGWGFTLGLWSIKRAGEEWAKQIGSPVATVNLPPAKSGNRFELAFQVENDEAVGAMYSDWRQRGIQIALEPMTAVFGRTLVGFDPNGHRIRVCIGDR